MLDLGTLLMKVDVNTGKAIKELQQVDKQVTKSSGKMTALDKVSGVCRKAFIALSAALAAGWAVLKRYSDKVGKFTDDLAKNAKRAGMTAEEYSKLSFQFERCGASAGTLNKVNAKLLGTEFQGNIQGALDSLMAISDESERIAKAEEMFGKRLANQLIPYLKQTNSEYNALVEDSEKFSKMTSIAAKNGEAYADALTNWQYASQIVQVIWAEEILPAMTEIINSMAEWIGSHQEEIESFLDKVAKVLGFVKKHINDILAVLLAIGAIGVAGKIASWVTAIRALIPVIISATTAAWGFVAALLANPITWIVIGIMALIAAIVLLIKNWDKVKAKLEKGIKAVVNSGPVQTAINAVKKLIDWWTNLKNKLKEKLTANVTTKAQDAGRPSRIGLREVPYDDYSALLHKGETILTAAETNQYKKFINGELPMQTAMQTVPEDATFNLYIDGRKFAEMTAPYMSNQINMNLKRANRKLGVV